MTAGNGEDPLAARARLRDLLDDGEDVTGVSERELLLRAVNSTLSTEHNVGMVLGAVARIETRVVRIEARLAPDGEIEHRARQASGHAFEDAIESVAERIVEAVHDERDGGRGNVSTARVLEMIREYDSGKDEKVREERRKFRRDLTVAIIAAFVGVVATGVAGEFHGRANAPQTVQTK